MACMETLFDIVRKRIDDGTITVTDLAERCGVTRAYIYKMLRGKSKPTLPLAEKLAHAVGAEITVKKGRSRKIPA